MNVKTASPALPRRSAWRILRRDYPLYFFVLPAVAFTLLFAYLPLFTNVIAFMDYSLLKGWLGMGSPWVGFKWFQRFLTDPEFLPIAFRTIYYSLAKLAFSFPAPIILALLLNELRSQAFKRTVQTISYLPYFVSWVTVSSLLYMFLSLSSTGLFNNILELFGLQRIPFMSKSRYFLPILVVSDLWKGVGWGSIIYLAAIASIEQQLYEAARIDGASRWQQMRFITLPGIMPAMVILLILTAGGIFNANFDQMFTLQNDVIRPDTHVVNTYAYEIGIFTRKFSLGTAINLFQGLINFVLVWVTNLASKRIRGTGLF
jgi:putative aldouronate transport system permease protein